MSRSMVMLAATAPIFLPLLMSYCPGLLRGSYPFRPSFWQAEALEHSRRERRQGHPPDPPSPRSSSSSMCSFYAAGLYAATPPRRARVGSTHTPPSLLFSAASVCSLCHQIPVVPTNHQYVCLSRASLFLRIVREGRQGGRHGGRGAQKVGDGEK